MKLVSLNLWGGKVHKPLMEFLIGQAKDTDIFCFQEMLNAPRLTEYQEGKNTLDLFLRCQRIFSEFEGFFNSVEENWVNGAVAEYPFCLLLPKFGCGSLKNTQNNTIILAFFQLRLAQILKACAQKSIRQQPLEDLSNPWGLAIFARRAISISEQGEFFVFREHNTMVQQNPSTIPRLVQYIKFARNQKQFTICNFHGLYYIKRAQTKKTRPKDTRNRKKLKHFLTKQVEQRYYAAILI